MPKDKSIITDKALREKLALQVMEMVNQTITTKYKQQKKEIPKGILYTKNEVKNWVNNPKASEIFNNIANKYEIKQKQKLIKTIKIDDFYQKIQDKQDNGVRFGYFFLKEPNTTANNDNNQYIKNIEQTINGKQKIIYDGIELLDNADPLDFAEMTEEEVEEGMFNNTEKKYLGFLNSDLQNSMSPSFEKDQLNNMTALVQNSPLPFFIDIYSDPISILLPPKPKSLETIVDADLKPLCNLINNKTKDIIEFEKYNEFKISQYISNEITFYNTMESNKKVKEMVNNGIFTKGMITQYKFVDKDGNTVRYNYVIDNYKDGKLQNGIQRVALTDREKEEIAINKKIASFKALKERIDIDYKKMENNELNPYYDYYFKDRLVSFHDKIGKTDFDNISKADLSKYIDNISKDIESIKYEYYRVTSKIYDVESYQKIYDDLDTELNSVEKEKGNYKYFAQLANETTNKISNNNNKSSSFNFLNKENFMTSSLRESPIIPLTKKEVLKDIAIIKQIKEKNKEYWNRGKIGRWWYKNSYLSMKTAGEQLVNKLEKLGFDKKILNDIGNDDKVKYGKFIFDSMEINKQRCMTNQEIFDKLYSNSYQKDDKLARQNVINNQIEELSKDENQIEKVEELKKDLEDFNKNKDIPENEFNKKVKEDTNELNKGSVKEAVDKNNNPEQIIEDIVEDNGKSV